MQQRPYQNLNNFAGVMMPMAGLGGTSQSTSTTQTKQDPMQMALGAGLSAAGMFMGMPPGMGGGMFGGSGGFSPAGSIAPMGSLPWQPGYQAPSYLPMGQRNGF